MKKTESPDQNKRGDQRQEISESKPSDFPHHTETTKEGAL